MARTCQIRGRKFLPCLHQTQDELEAIKAADKRRVELYHTLRSLGYANIPKPIQFQSALWTCEASSSGGLLMNEIECGQIIRTESIAIREALGLQKNVPGLLKKIIENRAWERWRIVDSHGAPRVGVWSGVVELPSLRALITGKPLRGWGLDLASVEAVISHDAEALAMFREAIMEDER